MAMPLLPHLPVFAEKGHYCRFCRFLPFAKIGDTL
jgi:hypothetical protein